MMTHTSFFLRQNRSVSALLRKFSSHPIAPSVSQRTLVLVDERVDTPHVLADGVREGVDLEMVRVDGDGIEQITDRLREFVTQNGRLDAVHICSHGSPGTLYLGNTTLNAKTIGQYQNSLQQWQEFLAPNANLLLYGCEVAAGEGAEFVRHLSQLTGAQIAASIDRTGSIARGGTWNLDFTTGEITEPLAFTPETIATYAGTFATIFVTNNNDSGAGSLREAIANATAGDTIRFDGSLANQTITLTSGEIEIGIGKDLVIDGADAANLTISGNNASRIFHVRSASVNPTDVTFANLTLTNGKTDERGGAIRTQHQAKLIIDNVDFTNNTADEGGGAIYSAFEGRLTISDSKFEGNEAIAGNDERGAGAIGFFGPDRLTVTNSDFINNRGIVGGAINSLNGELIVENSRFINNDTLAATFATGEPRDFLRGFGGAIYTDRASTNNPSTSGTIRITDSVFEGNSGRGEGGAAYLFTDPRDRVIIEGSTFEGNESKALTGGGAGGKAGGVIVLTDSGTTNQGLTITDTTFANNTAEAQGGALWLMRTPTTVTNTVFSGNQAPNDFGGAVTVYEAPIDINHTTFANNSAEFSGALAQGSNNLATVANTIFDNNTSTNTGVSFNNNQQTNRPINDGGNNIQSPGEPPIAPGITLADPVLGPLQLVDGVLVHPLLVGSPAIDAGANTSLTNDRRGATRPQDGDLNGSAIADIGAFEFAGDTPGDGGGTPGDGGGTPSDGGGTPGDGGSNPSDGGGTPGDGGGTPSDGGGTPGDGGSNPSDGGGEPTVKPTLPEIEQLLVQLRQSNDDRLLLGTLQDDFLLGDAEPDVIFGDRGSDAMLGDGNNDIIVGGDGADDGVTSVERDVLFGNSGNDTLSGGIDNDLLRGGQGNDLAYGDAGDDWIWGDLGDDSLSGGDGNDVVIGGSGAPTSGESDRDLMFGGAGNDAMLGNTGSDTIYGEDGNDIIAAGQGTDWLFGEAGEDTLYGDKGNDTIYGGEGNDLLIGGNGSPLSIGPDGEQDRLLGGAGNDTVLGNEGADTLSGDAGNDALFGGKDNDLIFGGVGDDRLSGDGGDDTLSGGDGSDRFRLGTGKGTDAIVDFVVGEDLVELTGGLTFAQLSVIQSGNDTEITVTSSNEVLATLNGIEATTIDASSFVAI